MEGEEILYAKVEYKYDGTGNLTSEVTSAFSFFTFELENSSRYTYQYISPGKVSVTISSNWEGETWVDEDKTETQYNTDGDVSFEIYSDWNGSSWNEYDKDEYLYSSTNFADVVFPNFYMLFGMIDEVDLTFNKLITGMNFYGMVNGSYINYGRSTFYYSSGTSTKIDETKDALFSVYPNPAAESVNFKWNGNFAELTLEMYHITGAKVLEQSTLLGKSVSLSKLEGGVYFYKLMDGRETVHSGKLIKY
jgi:hypothetical protein